MITVTFAFVVQVCPVSNNNNINKCCILLLVLFFILFSNCDYVFVSQIYYRSTMLTHFHCLEGSLTYIHIYYYIMLVHLML